jgi:lincosamide nucleotidyltransferase A/C/D/E
MEADDVIAMVTLLKKNQIDVILDGGWGVDALLGRQTRSHADLDIVIDHMDIPGIRCVLESHGYYDIPRDDSHEYNFVMGDENGHILDIHTCHFDESGNLVIGLDYPYDSLNGKGMIEGSPVKCITVEWMVKFHSGYKLDEGDYRDVKALCDQFSLPLPAEFITFENRKSGI